MENKTLTAVQWLELQLMELISFSTVEMRERYKIKFEIAKEIEKNQIIEAWDKACTDQDRIGREYYKQTYVNNA